MGINARMKELAQVIETRHNEKKTPLENDAQATPTPKTKSTFGNLQNKDPDPDPSNSSTSTTDTSSTTQSRERKKKEKKKNKKWKKRVDKTQDDKTQPKILKTTLGTLQYHSSTGNIDYKTDHRNSKTNKNGK